MTFIKINLIILINDIHYKVWKLNKKITELCFETGKDLVTINGHLLKTRVDDFTIHINQSKLINRDVMATNGVIHSVDSLITKGLYNSFNIFYMDNFFSFCKVCLNLSRTMLRKYIKVLFL